jgi:hypothetical protein
MKIWRRWSIVSGSETIRIWNLGSYIGKLIETLNGDAEWVWSNYGKQVNSIGSFVFPYEEKHIENWISKHMKQGFISSLSKQVSGSNLMMTEAYI